MKDSTRFAAEAWKFRGNTDEFGNRRPRVARRRYKRDKLGLTIEFERGVSRLLQAQHSGWSFTPR